MEKTNAVVRKVGDKFCVFSKDGKNLGCSTTREGAIKRLRQVEYFKNKGNNAMAKYDDVFDNMSLADMKPDSVDVPSNKPTAEAHRPVDITNQPAANNVIAREGSIAGHGSPYLLDQRDHFPVITETQARASMNRVMQLGEVPAWYRGTLDELRYEVYQGIADAHPNLEIKVPVPVEQVVALSDGEEGPETQKSDLKNPEDKLRSKVPQKPRPSIAGLTTEEVDAMDAEARQALAGDVVEMLKKQKEHLDTAMTLAQRLMKKGMSGEEFAGLISFLQEDILRHLMVKEASAGKETDRRAEILARMKKKDAGSSY